MGILRTIYELSDAKDVLSGTKVKKVLRAPQPVKMTEFWLLSA